MEIQKITNNHLKNTPKVFTTENFQLQKVANVHVRSTLCKVIKTMLNSEHADIIIENATKKGISST